MADRPYFGGSGGVRSGFVGTLAGARSRCMNSRHRIDWLGVRLLRGIALYIGFTEPFVGIRPTTSPRTSTTRLNRNESLANLSIIIAIRHSLGRLRPDATRNHRYPMRAAFVPGA